MTERTLVGIIANPASGKDIRRLVAHGSTFDNNEKINIVRRVLLGLAAAGVGEVVYLPDTYGIVERAAATAAPRLTLTPLSMASRGPCQRLDRSRAATARSRRGRDRYARRRWHEPRRGQGLRRRTAAPALDWNQ